LGTGFSYITLRGRWFGITVLNVHAPTEAKSDDTDVLRRTAVCTGSIPKYHTKILLGDFNVKLRREDIFKPTVGNESLHEINNHNEGRVVNFAIVQSMMFPHHSATFIHTRDF